MNIGSIHNYRVGRSAFGLVQLLVVVAVLGVLVAVGMMAAKRVRQSVKANKLETDVATLNMAAKIYLSNGGDLGELTDPAAVVEKLKTVSDLAHRKRVVGLGGSIVDQRVEVVPLSMAESASGMTRVCWDPAKSRFIICDSGRNGFKEIRLGDEGAEAPKAEARDLTLAYADNDKWIWNYQDQPLRPVVGIKPMALGSPGTGSLSVSNSAEPVQLAPPQFSVMGGTHSLIDYDLVVSMINPNPGEQSEVFYSTQPDSWQPYNGAPIVVPPSGSITAYAVSIDPDTWTDSGLELQNYTTTPEKLELAFAVPKLEVSYAEIGGAMIPGTVPVSGILPPGMVSLANSDAIPAMYTNSEVLKIRWTYDGSDPLAAQSSANSGSPFSNGFPGEEVDYSLTHWGNSATLPIKVAAESLNGTLVCDSDTIGRTLVAAKVQLRPPTIFIGADSCCGDQAVVIDLVTEFGDIPEGARIFYRLGGEDPGDNNGHPISGTQFLSPFDLGGVLCEGAAIVARVYPPEGKEHWFDTSDPSFYSQPVPTGAFQQFVCHYKGSGLCRFGLFAVGEELKISHDESGVDGSLAMAAGMQVGSDAGAVTGGYFVDPADPADPKNLDDHLGSGGSPLAQTPDADLPALKAKAIELNAEALALPATQSFGTLEGDTVISALASDGLNVIEVEKITLSGGDTLTLNGGPADWFIINITEELVATGGSIVYNPGVSASQVLYNFAPGSKKIRLTGGSMIVQGSVLAPFNEAALTGESRILGTAVIGQKIDLTGGSQIVQSECFAGGSTNSAPVVDLGGPSIAGTGYEFDFEGEPVAIAAAGSTVTDADDTHMEGGAVVLTNAQPGDLLSVAALPAGIAASVSGVGTGEIKVSFSGSATKSAYETAIRAVRFDNALPVPSIAPRSIEARVTDGRDLSNTATATAALGAEFFDVALEEEVLIVIDASGSMSRAFANTSRFRRVIQEAIDAINGLVSGQKFSVITFNGGRHWSDGSNNLKPANASNKQAMIDALSQLNSVGATNYEIGLDHAVGLHTQPKQIVFLSDGQPNQQNYLDEVAIVAGLGIRIDTIGIGSFSSQAPLQQMADLTGGSYRFVSEPGSSGVLDPPDFSTDGGELDYDEFPVPIALSNPNSGAPSQIRFSIDGGAFEIYSAPFSVGYNTVVEAYIDSPDTGWAQSDAVTESYTVRTLNASKPSISLSVTQLTDAEPETVVTLIDPNSNGVTALEYWFSSGLEADAEPYSGPFTLSAAEWESFASEDMKEVKIIARAVGTQGFVNDSDTEDEKLENKTTAFLQQLNRQPLEEPETSLKGDDYDYPMYPAQVVLSNPNNGVGVVQVSVDGGALVPYAGPITVGYGSTIQSIVVPTGSDAYLFRSSPVRNDQYEVKTLNLDKPSISATATEFTTSVSTITITLSNPNPGALSELVYWFDGQDEVSQAIFYSGPFTLPVTKWETYLKQGKDEAKLLVRAMGTESFVKSSDTEDFKFKNDR